MIDEPAPPNNLEAEQAVLGACLAAGRLLEPVQVLSGPEFYRPAHDTILDVMLTLAATAGPTTDRPCDPVLVNDALRRRDDYDRLGGAPYLHTLMQAAAVPANVGHYVDIVLDLWRARREIAVADTIRQRAYAVDGTADERLEAAEHALADVPGKVTRVDDTRGLLSLDQFIAQELPPEEWVMPGLLARGERLIVTGIEGWGKSTLARQIAVCAAAGMNPFTGRFAPPQTVLAVDLENPSRIMVDRYKALHGAVNAHTAGSPAGRNLWIDRRPDGVNLLDVADRRWLHRRMTKVKPDLLVIGPIYKMHEGTAKGESEETQARKVASTLDQFREEFDCALVLEAHSAKAAPGARFRTVEPIGSSLWLRWPEFGYGLRPIERDGVSAKQAEADRWCDFVCWKKRDNRDWPETLESSGNMPWVEAPPR